MFGIELLPGTGGHAEPQRGVDDVHVVAVVPVGETGAGAWAGSGVLVVVPHPCGDLNIEIRNSSPPGTLVSHLNHPGEQR